jgi:exportin-7
LQPFVVTALVQLLCRTTKLCWFDDDVFKNIVEDAKSFLEQGSTGGSQAHYFLGLKILNMLVAEFNQPTPGKTLTQHRKLSVAFRDTALLKVFQLSLVALKHLQTNPMADEKLKEQVGIVLLIMCRELLLPLTP